MLCQVQGCDAVGTACAHCGACVCPAHGKLRGAGEPGASSPGVAEREEWLCQTCAIRNAERSWRRLSN